MTFRACVTALLSMFVLTPGVSGADEPPTDGVSRTLGRECIHKCIPIDKDPWFFTIVPIK